ncbi:MAG: hypothetical protein COB49_00750 [Alphaproteobacteria bacterium]|nr:MAG: hypothetical protein COB49_00750 [Alphaproteobacteria bacterium]
MKNDKDIKQVSRLTGALLARKGSAVISSMGQNEMNIYPESAAGTTEELISQSSGTMAGEKEFTALKKADRSLKAAPVKTHEGKISTRKSKTEKSLKDPAVKKRIAMTLRMEEENHLRLRLYSAHTRKSCQVILSEALDIYLAENNDKVPLLKIASQNG